MFKLNSIMLVITSSLAINAIAAEDVIIEEEQTEKIFIVGSKQELTLQEVDASVELFNEDRLNAEHIIDLNDALIRIPNVSSSGSSSSIIIRGIGRDGATGAGQGVTSNVYIDGAPLSGTALSRGLTSFWDIQQVEVLRGSQSSIQGRNALAGAIIVTTVDPTYEQSGKFRLSYAEDNTYQIAGAYGNSLIDNQLAFRLAADIQETDGFIENAFFDENTNHEERLLLRAKFLFEPEGIDDLIMKLTIDHNDTKTGNGFPHINTNFDVTSSKFESFDPFDFVDTGINPRNDTKTTRFILDTHYALSDHWSIKSILTHEDTEVDRLFGAREHLDELNEFTSTLFTEEVDTAELRLTFDYDNISGVIGAYYFDGKDEVATLNEILLNPLIIPIGGSVSPDTSTIVATSIGQTKTKNTAVFAQVRIDLNKALTLDLGIRYDDEKFNNTGIINPERNINPDDCLGTVPGFILGVNVPNVSLACNTLVDALAVAPTSDIPQEAQYNAWLPKITLTYKLDDDHSIFASAQRGYRAGGSYLTEIANPDGIGAIKLFDTYEPEHLNTIEIGSRSVFANGDVVFNTNLFHSEYKDQQVTLSGESLSNPLDDLIVNAAESTISGIELSFEYFISQEWDIHASVGLLKAEYDDFPFAATGTFSNLKGNDLPGAPKVSGSIAVNWKGQNGFFANISTFYTGSQHSNSENFDNNDIFPIAIDNGVSESLASRLTEEVDSYVNVNLRFGYEIENIIVYAFATNTFNEEVVTDRSFAGVDNTTGEISLSGNGLTTTALLPPRTFGIGVDYSF
jgi:outer membrane receptor protein involved in Fe transport